MNTIHTSARVLLASSMLLVLASAHAGQGFTVTPTQEAQVHQGMSAEEVRQALGQPTRNIHYRNEPGATWTYVVVNGSNDQAVLDVDFSAKGTVASVGERIVPIQSNEFNLLARHVS